MAANSTNSTSGQRAACIDQYLATQPNNIISDTTAGRADEYQGYVEERYCSAGVPPAEDSPKPERHQTTHSPVLRLKGLSNLIWRP